MRRLTGPLCGPAGSGSNDQIRTIPAIRPAAATIPAPMDLSFTAAEEQFRAECRAWLAAHVPRPALPSGDTRDGFAAHLEWERTLFDARYAVVSWPREYGGREASLWEWLIFEEEYYAAGAPQRVTQNGIFLLAPTIFEFGTQEQKDRILAKMAAGEQTWCQGWSEPNAGSDLAGIQSKGVRDDAARRLAARRARRRGRHAARSARTCSGCSAPTPKPNGTAASRTSSSTCSRPASPCAAVERLDGDEGFAEVFLDDVFVPDADVLGEPNEGWGVAMATTGSERGLTLRSPGRFMATAQRLIDLARARTATTRKRSTLARPAHRRVDRRAGVPLADVLDRDAHRRGRAHRRRSRAW